MEKEPNLLTLLNDVYSYNLLFNSKEEMVAYLGPKTKSLLSNNFSKLNSEDKLIYVRDKMDNRVKELCPEADGMNLEKIYDWFYVNLKVYKEIIEQRKKNKNFDEFLDSIIDFSYVRHDRSNRFQSEKMDDVYESLDLMDDNQVILVLMGKGWLQTKASSVSGKVDAEKLKHDFNEMYDYLGEFSKKHSGAGDFIIDFYKNKAKNDSWRCQCTMMYSAIDIIRFIDKHINNPVSIVNALTPKYYIPYELIDQTWVMNGADPEMDRYELHDISEFEVNLVHLWHNYADETLWHYTEILLTFQETATGSLINCFENGFAVSRILRCKDLSRFMYIRQLEIVSSDEESDIDSFSMISPDRQIVKTFKNAHKEPFSYSHIKNANKSGNIFICEDKYNHEEISRLYAITASAFYIPKNKNSSKLIRIPKAVKQGLAALSMNNYVYLTMIPKSDINFSEKYIVTMFECDEYIDVTDIINNNKEEVTIDICDIENVTIDNDRAYITLKSLEELDIYKSRTSPEYKKTFSIALNSKYIIYPHKVTYKKNGNEAKEIQLDNIFINHNAVYLRTYAEYGTEWKILDKISKDKITLEEIPIDNYITLNIKEMCLQVKITTTDMRMD